MDDIDGLSFRKSIPLRTAFFCDSLNPICARTLTDAWFACNLTGRAEFHIALCGRNTNGELCGEIFETIVRVLSPVEDVCLPHYINCSMECQNAIKNASDAAGCCVNIFNNTAIERLFIGIELLIDEFALWSSCGVDTPGFCTLTHPESETPGTEAPGTEGSGAEVFRVTGAFVSFTFLVFVAVAF